MTDSKLDKLPRLGKPSSLETKGSVMVKGMDLKVESALRKYSLESNTPLYLVVEDALSEYGPIKKAMAGEKQDKYPSEIMDAARAIAEYSGRNFQEVIDELKLKPIR